MPTDLILPLFPPGSLDSSIITTTWIGIFVVAFFNLRFGWVLSGLIVPGYLVPLMIIKPWAAAVIVFESVVTYLLVWLYSEVGPRTGAIGSLFGRDRFFALVLMSVLVRLFFDGWALPLAGEQLNEWLGIRFDYHNNLQSFGLIIIALLANQYWKTGVRGAIIPLTVTVGLTLLITRYVLMEFTNFRISDVGYLYEDVAASILASPKAYIILITTAFIASRMNLHYGWEYNGILIPALLAMQWFQPSKILISLLEAVVIYLLAVALLHSPLLANRNVEGARKLMLFFNVGFAWKMLLGWTLPILEPSWKPTDYFGFGYLLSTLIALKVHDKGILARMTRATLQTSLTGVLLATGIGFALVLIPARAPDSLALASGGQAASVRELSISLADAIEREKVLLYSDAAGYVPPTPLQRDQFAGALQAIQAYLDGGGGELLTSAAALLVRSGYQLERIENRYLLLRESDSRRGWGTFLINLERPDGLVLELPDPLEQDGLLDSAVILFRGMDASVLAFPGTSRRRTPNSTQDVLRQFDTFFQIFHRQFGTERTLQLRAYTPAAARVLRRHVPTLAATGDLPGMAWIQTRLPGPLDLSRLERLAGAFEIRWGSPNLENRQADVSPGGFAQLFIDRLQIRNLHFRGLLASGGADIEQHQAGLAGYLDEELLLNTSVIAEAGSERYEAPQIHELMFADVEILAPLLQLLRAGQRAWTEEDDATLAALDLSARGIGMRVQRHYDALDNAWFLVLRDLPESASRHLGFYLFRLGDAQPVVLQVPRPRFERNALEVALDLFRDQQACCLLVAGAHPRSNADGSADPVAPEGAESLFNLVSQVTLREAGEGGRLAVQLRGYAPDEDASRVPADLILAPDNGAITPARLAPLAQGFFTRLTQWNQHAALAGAAGITDARFGIGRLPQAGYVAATQSGEFAILWLSPTLRRSYASLANQDTELDRFRALGIQTIQARLPEWLEQQPRVVGFEPPAQVRRLLDDYVRERDIMLLAALAQSPGFTLHRLLDDLSGEALLVLRDSNHRVLAVARLQGGARVTDVLHAVPMMAGLSVIREFLAGGQRWLVFAP